MGWIKKNSWWLGLLLSFIGLMISILTFLPSRSLGQVIGLIVNNPFPIAVVVTFCILFHRLWRLENQTKKKDSEPEHSSSSLDK